MLINQKVTFDAAHRLLGYEGNCSRLHGHTWAVEVEITSEEDLDECGMLMDYRAIKMYFKNAFDHTAILNSKDPLVPLLRDLNLPVTIMEGNPTAENLANMILEDFMNMLAPDDHVKVRIHESAENYAEVSA